MVGRDGRGETEGVAQGFDAGMPWTEGEVGEQASQLAMTIGIIHGQLLPKERVVQSGVRTGELGSIIR